MVKSAILGFPRIGANRELKKNVESFWKGNITQEELQKLASEIRLNNWQKQKEAGIDIIPSNDFSLYDGMLDLSASLGNVPSRYNFTDDIVNIETYFAMARGRQAEGQDVTAMEMTKWFDTNYHYIVPELEAGQNFKLSSNKIFDEYLQAKEAGIETRPVIVGPLTYLKLGKTKEGGDEAKFKLLAGLVAIYNQIFAKLAELGAKKIQIEEPALVLNLSKEWQEAYQEAYKQLNFAGLEATVATYFGDVYDNLETLLGLPVDGFHFDFVRGGKSIDKLLENFPKGKILSAGLVNGRNIWKTDLANAESLASKIIEKIGSENLVIATSCSLLHTPVDLACEDNLSEEVKNWLAFSVQKLEEVKLLADALGGKKDDIAFKKNADAVASRNVSTLIHNQLVKERVAKITPAMSERASPYKIRKESQAKNLNLPILPTTTIGSFPQVKELRSKRAQFKNGQLGEQEYNEYLQKLTLEAIKFQEEIGIDVLVHGEFERNDMVEYFGERLSGFAFTKNGWVQSYGSRCVKPPVIYGDVSRPLAMTLEWSKFAQENTEQIMKGMLTGPVTILFWSFVRDDQPLVETCKQIALAIRDEVVDLEKSGIKAIQIDEPAFREGLPLRLEHQQDYLNWAVDCFRISASGVLDETQIHTHMCYSEFNDMIHSIADMDADVISIETSRSDMELLNAFTDFKYPNQIGPGVYDIHSPRVPNEEEMVRMLKKALKLLDADQVWVNPDCGLKTRNWKEVKPALKKMVDATKKLRKWVNENENVA